MIQVISRGYNAIKWSLVRITPKLVSRVTGLPYVTRGGAIRQYRWLYGFGAHWADDFIGIRYTDGVVWLATLRGRSAQNMKLGGRWQHCTDSGQFVRYPSELN